MTDRKTDSAGDNSRMLTFAWMIVSAGLAYPVYSLLISWGFNQALAITAVFLGICLLYDIPYRARVKAQHHASTRRAELWRRQSY